MRILILLDATVLSRKQEVENALLKIREDYIPATPVTWEYQLKDLTNVPWVEYLPNALGISFDIVNKDVQDIYTRDGEKWDNIIYVVDRSNWKAPNIGGWNLGYPRKGYTVQIVLATENTEWLYKIFAMEIAHSWNDVCIQEINDNLLFIFDVKDFDNQVIHGVDPRYGKNVPPNAPMSGYYSDYNYRPMIAIAKDKLKIAYLVRKLRYENNTYFFKRDLYFGMSGDAVTELQKRFVREGLAVYTPTGYFGEKTRASAIAYQKRNGILPPAGFVGPKTRAILNKGMTPANPTSVYAEIEPLLLSEVTMWD